MSEKIEVRVEAPLADWPQYELTDGGKAARITGRYRAPSGWWQIGFPLLLMMIALALSPVSCSYDGRFRGLTGQEALSRAALWFGGFVVVAIAGRAFGTRRRVDVMVAPDAITIGGKRYIRAEGLNQFAIEEHEKAYHEIRSSQRGHPGRVYRDALQVVMRYGERRVPVADFNQRDVRKAEALLHRLQGFAAMMDAGKEQPIAAPGEKDYFGPARPIR
jgi:hypothetical protein